MKGHENFFFATGGIANSYTFAQAGKNPYTPPPCCTVGFAFVAWSAKLFLVAKKEERGRGVRKWKKPCQNCQSNSNTFFRDKRRRSKFCIKNKLSHNFLFERKKATMKGTHWQWKDPLFYPTSFMLTFSNPTGLCLTKSRRKKRALKLDPSTVLFPRFPPEKDPPCSTIPFCITLASVVMRTPHRRRERDECQRFWVGYTRHTREPNNVQYVRT